MGKAAKTIIAVIAITAALGGAVLWRTAADKEDKYRTVTAERRSLYQDVTFTGHIEAARDARLGFEIAGKVENIFVGEGDPVTAGQTLASLDPTLAKLELAAAEADQSSAERGAYLTWQKAAAAYRDTQAVNARALEKKRQAVRDAKAELNQDKLVHQQTAAESGDFSSTTKSSVAALKAAETTYHAARQTLEEVIKSAQKSAAAARHAAELAQADYLATRQTAQGVAGLSTLQAKEQQAREKLYRSDLTAPLSGTVTSVDKTEGEIVTAGESVVRIQTASELNITADATETDAAKLSLGMPATVTLDAYPDAEGFSAAVSSIAPAAVFIEGLPTYEITLTIESPQKNLKPGLTANITVHADQRENVIAVPRRAVIEQDGEKFTRVLREDGKITKREVTTGLLGSDGSIEITNGLEGGEKVIIDTVRES